MKEPGPRVLGLGRVGRVGGLEQDGRVGHLALDRARERVARPRILPAVSGEVHIRNNPEDMAVISLEELHALLPGRRQEELRPGPHPQELLHTVRCLGHEELGLLDQLGVEHRQIGRVEPDRVLDEDDHLDPCHTHVVVSVALILDGLDDRGEDALIALPDKDPAQAFDVRALQMLQFPGVVCQDHEGNLGCVLADDVRDDRYPLLSDPGHGDHQVEVLITQEPSRFLHG